MKMEPDNCLVREILRQAHQFKQGIKETNYPSAIYNKFTSRHKENIQRLGLPQKCQIHLCKQYWNYLQ